MSAPTNPESTTPPKRTRSPRIQSGRAAKKTIAIPSRPASEDREGWKAYWAAQGQPWRIEPEIDEERQHYLAERRAIKPDIAKGIYPFKDIEPKLRRADVEWLLATHEDGRGPVDWSDVNQRHRIGLDLRGADLRGVNLSHLPLACLWGGLTQQQRAEVTHEQRHMAAIHLEQATMFKTNLEGGRLGRARFAGANLEGVVLEHADLSGADFTQAYLRSAQWSHAMLYGAHLEGAVLIEANLRGADLRKVGMDVHTQLGDVALDEQVLVADVVWNGVPLTIVNWDQMPTVGDEQLARKKAGKDGKGETKEARLLYFQLAVRAYRQLAVALRDQGLNEVADRFSYRAQLLQRNVQLRQGNYLTALGSWLLWLIAGYGYKPGRSILIYLCMIASFAAGYFAVTHTLHTQTYPLAWYEALVLSVSSFHGRGFFQQVQSLGDPVAILAAIEAVFGLLIEISFIATFTQRFFGR